SSRYSPSHSGQRSERARSSITDEEGTSIGRSGAPPGSSKARRWRSRTSLRASRSAARRSVRARRFGGLTAPPNPQLPGGGRRAAPCSASTLPPPDRAPNHHLENVPPDVEVVHRAERPAGPERGQ